MVLAQMLAARAGARSRGAEVDCGALGTLRVEALPVRELELLMREPDADRAVFYAACRELQQAGETLRRDGRLFAPDEVLLYVSDGEAAAAARTVRTLSGWSEAGQAPSVRTPDSGNGDGQIRHDFVQDRSQDPDTDGSEAKVRRGFVQSVRGMQEDSGTEDAEIRHSFVQRAPGPSPESGQASCEEMLPETDSDTDKKPQPMGNPAEDVPQNLVWPETAAPPLHETTSEFRRTGREPLHEITSEFRGTGREPLHETTSEFRGTGQEPLHETTSEFRRTGQEPLHETTSEQGPETLRLLLEGLRRARWVRGG